MNLKEALSVLRNNNYLVEFLQDTRMLNYDKVLARINKECGTDFKRIHGDNSIYLTTDVDKFDKELCNKIEKIANIYHMHARFIKGYEGAYNDNLPQPNMTLCLDSSSSREPERIYKPIHNFRLFFHGSHGSPDIIKKTGLRPKECYGFAGVDGPERRVYLSSMDKWKDISDDISIDELADRIMNSYDNGIMAEYWYLVKLPKNFPIKNDPEGVYPDEPDDQLDWVYTLHAVPPQYILYLNGEGDYPKATKEDIIEFITNR